MFDRRLEIVVNVVEPKDGERTALDVGNGEAPHVWEFGRPSAEAAGGGVSPDGDGGVAGNQQTNEPTPSWIAEVLVERGTERGQICHDDGR